MPEPKDTDRSNDTRFKPGQSGNPSGRPLGARTRLAEAFVADVYADWQTHGKATLERVRDEKPDQYVKVVASILPRELNLNVETLDELSDDELNRRLADVGTRLADLQARTGAGKAAPPASNNRETKPPRVH